jgi:hypothetical protein
MAGLCATSRQRPTKVIERQALRGAQEREAMLMLRASKSRVPDVFGPAPFVQIRQQRLMSKCHDLVSELSEAAPTHARGRGQNLGPVAGPVAATRTGVSRLCDGGHADEEPGLPVLHTR